VIRSIVESTGCRQNSKGVRETARLDASAASARLATLLEAISKFLDTQHEMIERVRRDLVRGLKKPRQGRRGLTAPQVHRTIVIDTKYYPEALAERGRRRRREAQVGERRRRPRGKLVFHKS
jgi:hypothetical protein